MRGQLTISVVSRLTALVVAVVMLWMVITSPVARGQALGAFAVLLLTLLTLRIGIRDLATFWSSGRDSRAVKHVALLIGAVIGLQAGTAIVLDLFGRLDNASAVATGLIAWTLVPAVFLFSGTVNWPERCRSASKRQLVLTGVFALSLTGFTSFALLFWATERPLMPSGAAILMVLSGTIISAAAEEIVFRVLLLTALLDVSRSRFDALVLSSIAFGLAHAPLALLQPFVRANWDTLAAAAIAYAPLFLLQTALGSWFGALWLRTGSITTVVAAHAMYNLGNGLLYGL